MITRFRARWIDPRGQAIVGYVGLAVVMAVLGIAGLAALKLVMDETRQSETVYLRQVAGDPNPTQPAR